MAVLFWWSVAVLAFCGVWGYMGYRRRAVSGEPSGSTLVIVVSNDDFERHRQSFRTSQKRYERGVRAESIH